jgi:anthranilate/para-aminobenzoate synthase component II
MTQPEPPGTRSVQFHPGSVLTERGESIVLALLSSLPRVPVVIVR